jgi:HAD superfamily hydrolase (TIGR01509 family)
LACEKPFTPEGVIWDLDGTLLDTAEAHFLSWKETLEAYGVQLSLESFRADFGGNNLRSLTQWLGRVPSEAFLAEVADKKETLFRAYIRSHTSLFPGALTWLEYFTQAGMPQALATSAPPENISVSMDTFGLWHYFQKIVSGEKLPSKPNPASFLEAARQLNILPCNCLVIEDSEPGLLGAYRADMQVICKLGTVTQAPIFALAAFENFPQDPASYLAQVLK